MYNRLVHFTMLAFLRCVPFKVNSFLNWRLSVRLIDSRLKSRSKQCEDNAVFRHSRVCASVEVEDIL